MVDATPECAWGWLRPSRADASRAAQAGGLGKREAAEPAPCLSHHPGVHRWGINHLTTGTNGSVLQPIDLRHQGLERVIGVYRIETPDGPALFDCGPATCFERLRAAVDLHEIRHLLLSHIHLDDAGAAGHVVRENPEIVVHVSDIGAPHVVDPARLIVSARRLYGDELETLY